MLMRMQLTRRSWKLLSWQRYSRSYYGTAFYVEAQQKEGRQPWKSKDTEPSFGQLPAAQKHVYAHVMHMQHDKPTAVRDRWPHPRSMQVSVCATALDLLIASGRTVGDIAYLRGSSPRLSLVFRWLLNLL